MILYGETMAKDKRYREPSPPRCKNKINWKKVEEWLEAGARGTDIAQSLGISASSLYMRCKAEKKLRFCELAKEKRSQGMNNLRVLQYQKAQAHDTAMIIWLGKNWLEQRERPHFKEDVYAETYAKKTAELQAIKDLASSLSADEVKAMSMLEKFTERLTEKRESALECLSVGSVA